jgi:hypothetical protein
VAPAWIVREFEETLADVNERLVRIGPNDPLVSLRLMLHRIDHLAEAASAEQLNQAALFLGVELERRARRLERSSFADELSGQRERVPLPSLDELFEGACIQEMACGREIGSRSL